MLQRALERKEPPVHKNHSHDRSHPRRGAERNATQPLDADPRKADDDEEALEDAEAVPSLLTAREFQVRDPSKAPPEPTAERPRKSRFEDDDDEGD
jgi:hypothetical protein